MLAFGQRHGRIEHGAVLANLDGEYCTVLDTDTALAES